MKQYYKGWCLDTSNINATVPRDPKLQYTPFFGMSLLDTFYTQGYTMADIKSVYAIVRYPPGAVASPSSLPYIMYVHSVL